MANTKKQAPKEVVAEEMAIQEESLKGEPVKEGPATAREAMMYIGPTIAKFGVVQNTVYTMAPGSILAAIEAQPLLENLFIRAKDYPDAERSIRERAGLYWLAYKEAQGLQ